MAPESASRRINMKWYIVIAGIVFIALLAYSSFHQSVFQVRTCVNFLGRSHCSEASGRTEAAAIRSAEEIDCELIANGRDQNIACLATQPSSVRVLSVR